MAKALDIKRLGIKNWLPSPALRKKAIDYLLPTLIWLAIISLLRWDWQLPVSRQAMSLVSLWLGGVLGTFLLDIDHLLYLLVIYPNELTSRRVRKLLDEKRIKDGMSLVTDTFNERIRLPFHSALFQPLLYILCFFVLTSTGSLFGAGLVMAMALHLLREELECLLRGKEERLRKCFFWQVKEGVSPHNQKFFVILMLLFFLGLNLLLI